MKNVYTNTPINKRKKEGNPPLKTLIIMSAIIALMFGIKFFYNPTGNLDDLAVMADALNDESDTTHKTSEPDETDETHETDGKIENTIKQASYQGETSATYDTLPAAITSETTAKTVDYDFVFPLDGEITSAFAERVDPFGSGDSEFHKGIDIAGESTDIHAYANGTVETVDSGASYGNYLIIRHSDTLQTLYAHCEEIYVEVGDIVNCNQKIAKAGKTGRATGVHLHFEVRINGYVVDPVNFLK